MSKKTVIALAKVKAGAEEDFKNLTAYLIKGSRAEAGCISYTLYQSPEDSTDFIFYEEYEDDAAIEAHGSSAHFTAFAKAVKPLMAADLVIEKY